MKPICKSEARYAFWRWELGQSKRRPNGFAKWMKRCMAKARRRHLNSVVR